MTCDRKMIYHVKLIAQSNIYIKIWGKRKKDFYSRTSLSLSSLSSQFSSCPATQIIHHQQSTSAATAGLRSFCPLVFHFNTMLILQKCDCMVKIFWFQQLYVGLVHISAMLDSGWDERYRTGHVGVTQTSGWFMKLQIRLVKLEMEIQLRSVHLLEEATIREQLHYQPLHLWSGRGESEH